ncbi:MAG TPA: GNAT family N-acetyltransferase [Nocardioidaceae bacterium]|nr:GNAT family N-acetyltransferase [Nocardioidaceae bacterium]
MNDSLVPDEEELLANGWEPDLAPTDTLVRQTAVVHASWGTALAEAIGRPWRWTDDWAGGFIADRGALSNMIMLLRPPTDPGAVIAEIAELIPATSPYLMVSPWLAPDLTPYGLVKIGHPPLMVRFPKPHDEPSRDGVELREVTNAEELAIAERVLVEGYPMPDLEPLSTGDLWNPSLLSPTMRMWIAYIDGEPAAVSSAHLHEGVTLVEYVATLPVARGRGAGAAVTWAATLADPARPAVLLASDDGRPVYERMGYLAIERWTAWLRPAAG